MGDSIDLKLKALSHDTLMSLLLLIKEKSESPSKVLSAISLTSSTIEAAIIMYEVIANGCERFRWSLVFAEADKYIGDFESDNIDTIIGNFRASLMDILEDE